MRILFFGTPDFSVPALQVLISNPEFTVVAVVTQPDRPAGRGSQVRMSPVKVLALEHSLPVLQPTSLRKDPLVVGQLEALGPFDVGIVIAFGQILPQKVLDLPRHGCINIHASLLPRWRGAAPIHRAILAGDQETGVCLMKMEAGLDTGPVYCREVTSISLHETAETLHDRLAKFGATLLEKNLAAICNGEIPWVAQPEDGITYAQKIDVAEALIDWSASAADIDRTVRAFSPFPGAYTSWNGKRLKILAGTPVPRRSTTNDPGFGKAVFAGRDRLEISCRDAEFLVTEVQLEGKKRMGIGDFLRGNAVGEGAKFGERG